MLNQGCGPTCHLKVSRNLRVSLSRACVAHVSHSFEHELESTEDNFKLTTQNGEDDAAAWAEKSQLVRQRGWYEGKETFHCYLIPSGL